MKKLVAIIIVLLAILLAVYSYKTNIIHNKINVEEVEKIQELISKMYLWKEICEDALPRFNNINEAPDLWTWEVVKKNLDKYELKYEDIQKKADEIFGKDFAKKFPKEGTDYIYWDEKKQEYFATGIGLDTLDDMFFIKNIKRNSNGYEVEIIEYLEDYTDEFLYSEDSNENKDYNIYIRNLDMESIITIKNNELENVKIDKIKENIDKFSTKVVTIVENNNNLYVESVK